MAKGPAGQTVNIGGEAPDVRNYYMLGDAGAVTLTGCLYDGAGHQRWLSVSLTIPVLSAAVTDAVKLETLVAAALGSTVDLKDWVGFVGNTNGGVRWTTIDPNKPIGSTSPLTEATSAAILTDFKNNPTKYPLLAAGNSLRFGAVSL